MNRIVILVLVLAVLVGLMFFQKRQQSQVVASAPVEVIELNPDRVSRMLIEKPDQAAVELTRIGGGWRITQPFEYRAQDPVVQTVLKSLEDLALADIVSTNPEKRSTYQVDSTGTRVQVWEAESRIMDLVIGKASPDYGHTYVRPTDEDRVYRASGVLTYNFNKKPDDWRDKAIINLEEPQISRVVLEYPKEKLEVALTRADSIWTYTSKDQEATADSATATRLVRSAAKLMTASFVAEEEAATKDFSTPDFRLKVETDSETHTVDFVNDEDGNRVYARHEGQENVVFQLFKGSLTNLMKKAEDLAPKS